MARSAVSLGRVTAPLAAGLVLTLTLGTLAAVAWRAEAGAGLSVADWAAVRFTLWQALVSAAISVLLAIPTARALARRRFAGRNLLITLLGAPFLLPVIVAVLGLIAVFGRNGIINEVLNAVGLPNVTIYGAQGVILAHVFFNLPLAIRLVLQGWLAIPAERFRLVATLNGSVFRLLEIPMLRQVLPSAFLVIFLICLTSFAVALTLGGGPRATTVELAIYQAIQFDFDLGRAALLALIQFGLCALAAGIAWGVTPLTGFGPGLDRVVRRWDNGSIALDLAWLAITAFFLLLPLSMVVIRGLPGLADMPPDVWRAAIRSLWVATGSAIICIGLSLALALRGGFWVSVIGVVPLAASALVMGTGLFILTFPFASPRDVALIVTMLVNPVMALPFALRAIAPAVATAERDFGKVASSLGITGWQRLRLLILPRIRQPLGFAAGLAAALSMGDLGVIALFAGDGQATLPLTMFRLIGAYRMDAAAGAALVLVVLSFLLFWICDQGGRWRADP